MELVELLVFALEVNVASMEAKALWELLTPAIDALPQKDREEFLGLRKRALEAQGQGAGAFNSDAWSAVSQAEARELLGSRVVALLKPGATPTPPSS